MPPLDAGGHEEWAWPFPRPCRTGGGSYSSREAGPESGIYAAALDVKPGEQRRTRVLPDPSAPWYVPGPNRHEGTLLFVRERTLMAQTLDPDTVATQGYACCFGDRTCPTGCSSPHRMTARWSTSWLGEVKGSLPGSTWKEVPGQHRPA